MVDSIKQPKLVGSFIRKRRESKGLSQRALGLLFEPPVTTQFISNVERGVTPLPPVHIATLTRALEVPEDELLQLLEKEYSAKLTGRLGFVGGIPAASDSAANHLNINSQDIEFMRRLYDSYRHADEKTRQAFKTVCETIFKPTHE